MEKIKQGNNKEKQVESQRYRSPRKNQKGPS